MSTTSTSLIAQPSRKIKLTPVSLGFDLPDSYKQREALEIKNLEELSEEKLRALGFDVEILKR